MSGKPLVFTRFQVGAIVILVAMVAAFVGLMTGLTPPCVEPEDITESRRSLDQGPRMVGGRSKVQADDLDDLDEVRLPAEIRPNFYNLTIHPDLTGSDIFSGTTVIDVTVTGDGIRYPRIHAKYINITSAIIHNSDGDPVDIANTFYHEYNEFFVMDMGEGEVLSSGNYKWTFEYTGGLGGKIVGFYKSSYANPETGVTRYLATTDFEPTDARQAFPCFDEPNIKSSFKIKLIHESKYIGLSNMPAMLVTDLGGDLTETEFGEPEVKMSTYLVAFIVCDFDYVEGFTKKGVQFRVYAPDFQIHQASYSLALGINITDYYEEYFNVDYSLSKLDMIAIPDFNSGAMENWGLITYRERYLLFDEGESSASDKQRICAVVAHELAHQAVATMLAAILEFDTRSTSTKVGMAWKYVTLVINEDNCSKEWLPWFGNIVTMDWWDDLWLNEGFASYVEYIGAANAEPTWGMMDQFVVSDMYYVFGLDQIVSSHPIIVDVNRPEEITEVFDSIPYSKGASVIRMLNDFIGEESFREGLTDYLETYQFANAKSSQLWAKLQAAYDANGEPNGEIDVAAIMDTWTKQMGFPVIDVTRLGNNLRLNQDWFLVDPEANRSAAAYPSEYNYEWEVPFTSKFQLQLNTDPVYTWMAKETDNVAVPGDASDWYIANYEQKGYYRVNYDVANWNDLSAQLKLDLTQIPVADRSGLLDDAFNLARAEQLDYDTVLDMTIYLDQETEYVPWDAAYSNLLWLQNMLRYQPAYANWRLYMQNKTKPLLNKYSDWSEDLDHLDTFLRSDIIYLSCSHGDQDCLDEAFNQFNMYLNDEYVSPDVRSPVLRFGMQQDGGQENWDMLWERYTTTDLSSEKSRLMYGMARTRHVWLLSRFLEFAEDDTKVRGQDYFTVLNYIADNPVGNPLVWDYTRANWPKMVDRFGLDSRSLGRLVPGITESYTTELQLQQMEDFFAKYPEAGAGTRGRQQALERVRTNINWVKRNKDTINAWLGENVVSAECSSCVEIRQY